MPTSGRYADSREVEAVVAAFSKIKSGRIRREVVKLLQALNQQNLQGSPREE